MERSEYRDQLLGVWRSWLARAVWDREVEGSSPFTPTTTLILFEHTPSECRSGAFLLQGVACEPNLVGLLPSLHRHSLRMLCGAVDW